MEQQPTSHVVKGLIISAIILLMIIVNHLRNDDSNWSQYIIYSVFAVGIIISCRIYSNQLKGNVLFGNVFAHGFKTSAVATIMVIFFVVLLFWLLPDMKEKVLAKMNSQMAKEPGMSKELIEKSMTQYRDRFMSLVVGTTLFGYVVIGLLASLIGAAIAKRNPDTTNKIQA